MVDDERFDLISSSQWTWYAAMIAKDEEEEYNKDISITEYLASFWNAEAVQKIKAMRDSKSDQRFASDEEFEKQILENSFKDDEFLKSVIGDEENTNSNDNIRRGIREARIPKDLSSLRKLFGDS